MLLLSIDENKVRTELRKSRPSYSVAARNLEMKTEGYPAPSIDVTSAVMVLPPEVEKAIARINELRQRLIDSGSKPLSRSELDVLKHETRGR
jgi:hypothetical protein